MSHVQAQHAPAAPHGPHASSQNASRPFGNAGRGGRRDDRGPGRSYGDYNRERDAGMSRSGSGSDFSKRSGPGYNAPYNRDSQPVASSPRGAQPSGVMYERLLFATTGLIGQAVQVQTKSGSLYSGVFYTANTDRDYGVVLQYARLVHDGTGKVDQVKASRQPPVKFMLFHSKDLVQVIAQDISLADDRNGIASENGVELATDSAISRGRSGGERELKRWTPDEGDSAPDNLRLDNTFSAANGSWDQFSANRQLFGVKSTFDEHIYTTKIDPETRQRNEKEAARLAREIESQVTRSQHLAEERGHTLDDSGIEVDEEERYSSVLRAQPAADADKHNDATFGDDALTTTAPAFPAWGANSRKQQGATPSTALGNGTAGLKDPVPARSASPRPASDHGASPVERPTSAASAPSTTTSKPSPLSHTDVSKATLPASPAPVLVARPSTLGPSKLGDSSSPSPRTGSPRVQSPRSSSPRVSSPRAGTEPSLIKERLRVRLHIVNDKSKRAQAAYGPGYASSPLGRSPMKSPLVGDPEGLKALNLEPVVPAVPEQVYREYLEFKSNKLAKPREETTNELKSFSESLSTRTIKDSPAVSPRAAGVRTPHLASTPGGGSTPRAGRVAAGGESPSKAEGASSTTTSAATISATCTSAPSEACALARAAAAASVVTAPNAATATSTSTPTTTYEAPSTSVSPSSLAASALKKSTLNPAAKEFKLNPNAKSFTPVPKDSTPTSSAPCSPVPNTHPAPLSPGAGAHMYAPAGMSPVQMPPGMMPQMMPYGAMPMPMGGPHGGFVGGPYMPGAPGVKMQPGQVMNPMYAQQQAIRAYGGAPPMQPPGNPGFIYPNGQQFHPAMAYGPNGQPVMTYMPQMPPQHSQSPQQHKRFYQAPQGPPAQYIGPPAFVPGQPQQLPLHSPRGGNANANIAS
eukprot:jgi/Chlat1/8157/Chrsp76S07608